MKMLTDKELNTIRGKAMVGHASPQEILSVFGHLDALEMKLESSRTMTPSEPRAGGMPLVSQGAY